MTPNPDPAGGDGGSVSQLVDSLRAGDRAAADRLWDRYFRRMAAVARRRLWQAPQAADDAEDVALSAFMSFFRTAHGGGWGGGMNRARVWGLLESITAHKAADVVAREGRRKRGGGLSRTGDVGALPASDPPPEAVAAAADEFRRMLDRLADPALQAVALLRIEGYTAGEIAERLGCVPRTVERRLQVIRCLLADGGPP